MDINTFQNICRTCMSTFDLILIQDNNITDVLQFLSGTGYSKTDELPQKLCLKCFETMKQIQLFAFKCQQTLVTLSNSLNNKNKHNEINKIEFVGIKQEHEEPITTNFVKEETLFQQKILKHEVKDEQATITETNEDQHEAIHNNRFECDICLKHFQILSKLIRHKRIHSGERPYQCEVCNKSFTNKSHLVNHRATHSEERRFNCDICAKGFKLSGDLNKHKKVHTGERPYQCEICNKACSTKSNLVIHKATHSDERRFECDICKKGFKYSFGLNKHKRIIHSGERPFKCEVCDRRFGQKSHLVTHMARHSGERQWGCDVCNKRFITSSHLRKHKFVHLKNNGNV